MYAAADKNFSIIEAELKFIRRHVSNIQTDDYEAQRDIDMAVESALRALFEHKLNLEPACEEVPAGVQYPEAA
jgi:hypothetical protein